jgi:cell wall-associated NlpC family hydrolase
LNTRVLFSPLLVMIAALSFSTVAIAQSSETEARPTVNPTNVAGSMRPETERPAVNPVEESRPRLVTPVTPVIDSRPAPIVPAISVTGRSDQLLLTAMQSHVGASYHFNRTGPDSFDCSGFVWRSFQDMGVNFQRGPARSYWATMPAPPTAEQFKFGTLVFFSNLRHVGIVVDEKGFYHSARHGGVMYSPFNEYWLSRIDGFRRVPTEPAGVPAAKAKPAPAKPAASVATLEQDDAP